MKISSFPSVLLRVEVFSVAMSPLYSITTKRPFADMSPVYELRAELVTCATNGSGVGDATVGDAEVRPEESAPATSQIATAADIKARNSLSMKTPQKQLRCSPGIEPK